VSKDTSELSNSLTAGSTGTRKYKAPEFSVPGEVSGQAPADVFALGLVLLSLWSTLEGWLPDDPQNFSNLGSTSPFYENISSARLWIEDRLEGRILVPTLSSRNELQRKWDITILRVLSRMIVTQPSERIRISEVVAIFRTLSIKASFCLNCQELLSEDEPEEVEMEWVTGSVKQIVEDDSDEEVQTDEGCSQEHTHLNTEDDSSSDVSEKNSEEVEFITEHLNRNVLDEVSTTNVKVVEVEKRETQLPTLSTSNMAVSPARAASPPLLKQESMPPPPPSQKDQRIIFVDCYGRRYPCPFHSVNKWEVCTRFSFRTLL
jgi:serine/threonine protein kinase